MSTPPTSRKRPAPGASPPPATPLQPPPQQYSNHDQMLCWNGVAANGNSYADVSSQYMQLPQQPAPQAQIYDPRSQSQTQSESPSNVLALRDSGSRALVPAAPRTPYDGQSDQWTAETALVPATNGARVNDPEEEIRLLETRARKIAEEANKDNPGPNQKRSIPPFVLKLASFLNNGKNSDLIRWSEKGDSFIVLDEDEFAKKLIPEMFKHNNYASFVRQLNMYGFHKRVGLSDNSMRASEKKNKSPSEYAHPYFLRGHDILQWLIQKPNKNSGKRAKQAKNTAPEIIEPDSEDDYVEDVPGQPYAVSGVPGKPFGRNETGPLAKTEMGRFREQLVEVQQKQQQILAMIHQMRQSQQEIMQKAHRVEQMHQRHENSITAILNFLANVFRKSLEEKGGAQNLSELLASIIPHNGDQVPLGTVQDLGDFFQQPEASGGSMSPVPQKRSQHLLPGIPQQPPAAATASPPGPYPAAQGQQTQQSSRITEVFDASPSDTTSPNTIRHDLQSNPQETMRKIMDNTNARMTPGVNLPDVAATTSASMSNDQRNRMLSSMSRRTVSPSLNLPPSAFPPPQAPVTAPMPSGSTPTATSPVDPNAASLSPILNLSRAPSTEAVSEQVAQQQDQLDAIHREMGEVTSGIRGLASLVSPLSPNGHIPGYDGPDPSNTDNFNFNPADPTFDVSQWLDTTALDGGPFNFDLEGMNGHNGGTFGATDGTDFDFSLHNPNDFGPPATTVGLTDSLTVPATAAKDTPSPDISEETQRTDMGGAEQPSVKRRRYT